MKTLWHTAFAALALMLLLGQPAAADPIPTNLTMWLDAGYGADTDDSGTSAAHGQDVQVWQDRTGSILADHVRQTNPTYKPQYMTDMVNSRPALYFDGSDALYNAQSINLANNGSGSSGFAVINANTANVNNAIFSKLTGDINFLQWGGGHGLGVAEAGVAWVVSEQTVGVTGWQIVQYTYDAGTGIGKIWRNNELLATGIPGGGTYPAINFANNTNLAIGSDSGTPNASFNGYMAELLIYDRPLNDTELAANYSYLYHKYVPEPGTAVMLLIAAGLLLLRRRIV